MHQRDLEVDHRKAGKHARPRTRSGVIHCRRPSDRLAIGDLRSADIGVNPLEDIHLAIEMAFTRSIQNGVAETWSIDTPNGRSSETSLASAIASFSPWALDFGSIAISTSNGCVWMSSGMAQFRVFDHPDL